MKKIIKKGVFVFLLFGAFLSSCTPNESNNIIYSMSDLPNNIESLTDNALEYTLSETGDSYIVTGMKDKSINKIQIPAIHDNKKVEAIGKKAFAECDNLECVSFSDDSNIKQIMTGAFLKCINLKTIIIPKNISIGGSAFMCCNSLTVFCEGGKDTYELSHGWDASMSMGIIDGEITITGNSITLPFYWDVNKERLLTIEKNGCCYALIDDSFVLTKYMKYYDIDINTDIVIPSTISFKKKYKVTAIGDWSFVHTNIASVKIPNSVTSIGSGAFNWCPLTSVEIPSSVSSLGSGAFAGCMHLTDITFSSSVKSIGDRAFQICNSLENVYYDGTIEDWCNIRFSDTYYYTSNYDSGPNGLIYETSNPMAYASHFYLNVDGKYQELSEIVIPDGIKNIGVYQFYGFKNIVSISLPESVTSIGDYAFSDCEQLKKISISSNVTSIGLHAFSKCYNLEYNEYDNASYLGNDDNPFVCLVKASTNITSCNINPKTSVILAGAFYDCSSLTSIIIPDSVISIGMQAFDGCTSLTNITIPSSVSSLGYGVFIDCVSLNFTEYDNAYYLGNDDNPFLWLIESKDQEITSCIINENTRYIYNRSFYKCESLTEITIPNNVTYIGDGAFNACESLTHVTLSNNLTSFGQNVFYNCNNLQYNEDNDAYYIGSDNNPYLCLVDIKNTDIESFDINENTYIICDYAFSKCTHLKNVYIHKNVFYIGFGAFKLCYSLTIYCEMEVQPSTWHFSWNIKVINSNYSDYKRIPVVWGYSKE